VAYDDILYEVDDPVAVITLNRPASLNAWTNTRHGEIRDAMTWAAADPAVVGILVTGAAERDAQRLTIKSFGRLDFKEGVDSFNAGASTAVRTSRRLSRTRDAHSSGPGRQELVGRDDRGDHRQ
jgi:1,4-dihydroxy-2-naphthoyl-CoA synthase